MKLFKILILTLLGFAISFAQNIGSAEYFIDQDPGFDSGTPITNLEGGSATFSIDQSGFEPGFHILYVRVKDGDGQWSIAHSQPFFVNGPEIPDPADLAEMEYFIDQDPGFGSGTAVDISAGYDFESSFSVTITGLETGMHILYTRVKNINGEWNAAYAHPFYIPDEPASDQANVDYMEYFIDQDPGLGAGTSLSLTPGQSVNRVYSVNLEDAEAGLHILYTRFKDVNGSWSLTHAHPFFKLAAPQPGPPNVAGLVYYFFQNDSIFPLQVVSGFEQGQDVEISFTPNIMGINVEEDYDVFIFPIDVNGKSGVPFTLNDSLAVITDIEDTGELVSIPDNIYLKANYPNPFNPSTTISFGLPAAGNVQILVFDMLGKKVAEVVNQNYAAGNHFFKWNGTNSVGKHVASGMYIYKLIAEQGALSRKMLLLR